MNNQIGKNYINGEWHPLMSATDTLPAFKSYNPSNGEVIGHFPETSPEIVQQAVGVARDRQRAWRSLSRIARADFFANLSLAIKKHFDKLVEAISYETGKSLNESKAEVNEALHMAQYTFGRGRDYTGHIVASEIAEKDVSIFRKPKGVVGVISPWNFPFAIGGFWTSAPALLEGNTVVFKPSEETPYIGHLIAELYEEAGFPPGVFNLVHGAGSTTGAALVHANVDHICFTGSAEVGREIRRVCNESWKKSCSCEMGSKSAVIVFDDANVDLAVQASVASAFKLTGQRCVSAGRLLVQHGIFDKFVEKFVEATKKLTFGDPFNTPTPDLGPLINQQQLRTVLGYNQATLQKANQEPDKIKVLLEGKQVGDKGNFVSPHVYTSEWAKGEGWGFLREEVFGPHVAIVRFKTPDDAVKIYNDTDYGLSMAALTNNMHIARYMRDNCDFGLGYLNLPCIGAESHLPFGGVKKSGYGGSSAAGTFHNVTHEVTWTANYDQAGFKMAQGLK